MGARLSYPEAEQSGRVAVVTGGNTGIGYETAKGLALLGAHVVIACRSVERAIAALERMRAEVSQEHPDKSINVEFMSLDLSSLQSVKTFIEDYKQKGLPLHLLINNAGIAIVPQGTTDDGFERHFQVNHLGHFYLTLELLPLILTSAPDARIVFVSSSAHRIAYPFDLENLQGEKSFDRMRQYGCSKLYNILTAAALQRRTAGRGLTVSALHPGIVETEISRNFTGHKTVHIINAAARIFGQYRDAKKGAVTSLYAAVHPELNKEEFVYYSDCKPAYMTSDARNIDYQEQLWRVSCELLKDYLSPDIAREYRLGGDQPSSASAGEQPEAPDQTLDEMSEEQTPVPEQTLDETSEVQTPEQTLDKTSEVQTPEQTLDKTSEGQTPEQILDETSEELTPEQTLDKTSEGQTPEQTLDKTFEGQTPEQILDETEEQTPEQILDETSEELQTPDQT